MDQVADLLQIKPRTVYQWVHEGYIPIIRLGSLVRFSQTAVSEWLRKREVPGRAKRAFEVEVDGRKGSPKISG